MTALPNDSSITIDDFTINAPAAAVMLWEAVVTAAISRGDTIWVRLGTENGRESVLVHPGSKVRSHIGPQGTSDLSIDQATKSNLAALVDEYVKPNARTWKLAEVLGIDAEIRANHAAEAEDDGAH